MATEHESLNSVVVEAYSMIFHHIGRSGYVDIHLYMLNIMNELDNWCRALGTSYKEITKRHERMAIEHESHNSIVNESYSMIFHHNGRSGSRDIHLYMIEIMNELDN